MPGFPLHFDAGMDAAIERISKAAGMKKRPWVMSLIVKAIKDADAPKMERVLKLWHFRMKAGDVLSHPGESPGAAWVALGYQLDEMELVDEHWSTRYNAPEPELKLTPTPEFKIGEPVSATRPAEMATITLARVDELPQKKESADELSFFHT